MTPPGIKRPVVLVVDDVAANVALMTAILKPYYDLRVAIDGTGALRVANSEAPPDLTCSTS